MNQEPAAKVDLHSHSYYSDGAHPPEKVVRMAVEAGLRALALTDHDTVSGLPEAADAARILGIELVPGVEFSTRTGIYEDIHILGLFLDFRHEGLLTELKGFKEGRRVRAAKIVERINRELGAKGKPTLDFEAIYTQCHEMIGRPHLAAAMIELGVASDQNDAFDRYLTPYNLPKIFFDARKTIDLTHQFGGVAVLAHPHRYTTHRPDMARLIQQLAAYGLDGMEILCPNLDVRTTRDLQRMSKSHSLLPSGGSDYHVTTDTRRLGMFEVPAEWLERLRERAVRYQKSLAV